MYNSIENRASDNRFPKKKNPNQTKRNFSLHSQAHVLILLLSMLSFTILSSPSTCVINDDIIYSYRSDRSFSLEILQWSSLQLKQLHRGRYHIWISIQYQQSYYHLRLLFSLWMPINSLYYYVNKFLSIVYTGEFRD